MIAKILVFLAVVAAVRAGGRLGVGAPLLGAGHLGLVSAQRTAINYVAPATRLGHTAPLAYGHGFAAAPLTYGLGATPFAVGHGHAAGNLRADGIVGSGILGSRYGSAIAHNAAVGHGLTAAPLAYGLRAAPLDVGHRLAAGNLRADGIIGSGILGSRYGSAIAHNAAVGHGLAATPLAYGLGAAHLAVGHRLAAGNLRADGIVGNGILGSRYGSTIAHNAPVGHGLAAAPLAYGLGAAPLAVGHGLAAGNLRSDGIVGSGILGSRYGSSIAHTAVAGHGLLGGAYHGRVPGLGHGAGLTKAIW